MPDTPWIVLAVVVVVVTVTMVWVLPRNRRSDRLKQRFGPEYDRTVRTYGDVTRAESDLNAREQRVRGLDIRPLTPGEAERCAAAWRRTQARFVDDPRSAIADADRLVQDLMKARAYPVGDFEQRVADVSVDHPRVVEHYRAAHRVALATAEDRSTTEDRRQALVHYRALFEDLLEVSDDAPRRMVRPAEAGGLLRAYRPLQCGFRFSRNARTPSWKSSLA
jgi:hypothetical protein